MNWSDWYDTVFLNCEYSGKENNQWICGKPNSNLECLWRSCPYKNNK